MNISYKKELSFLLLLVYVSTLFFYKCSNLVFAETTSSNSSSSSSSGSACLVSFSAAKTFSTGKHPRSVTTSDFNNDGKIDLAVANDGYAISDIDSISILLGNGDGTFEAAKNSSIGTAPQSVTTNDFNGDGKIDLAVANLISNDVSILLGKGNGSFSTAKNFSVGDGPFSVVTNDFNNDQKIDLAVANINDSNVSILLGNGSGSFGIANNFPVDGGPYSVTASDLNDDGKIDLATTSRNNNNVSILLGNKDGTFNAPSNFSVGNGPYGVTTGDFNSDGKIDLATANFDGNDISVLLGNGNGSFGTTNNFSAYPGVTLPSFSVSPDSITTGDFNGDGKIDLATANANGYNVSIFLGNGDGTFTANNFSTDYGPHSITTGDFNGDGKIDLVTTHELRDNISILLNHSSCVANPSFSGVWKGIAKVASGDSEEESSDTQKLLAILKLCVIDGELKGSVNISGIVNNGEIVSQNVKSDNEIIVNIADKDGQTNSINLKLIKKRLSITINSVSFLARKTKAIKKCQ